MYHFLWPVKVESRNKNFREPPPIYQINQNGINFLQNSNKNPINFNVIWRWSKKQKAKSTESVS